MKISAFQISLIEPVKANIPKAGDTIVVWVSCGAASAVAAKKIIELYGDVCKIRLVNNPILEEHPDNQAFLDRIEPWLGLPIDRSCVNPKYPKGSIVEVFEKKEAMSFVRGAVCTEQLKKKARYHWEKTNHFDWLVLGFTVDEKKRSNDFKLLERPNLLEVLIDEQITKKDCFKIIENAGIALPEIYSLGYPNANCIGCVKSDSPYYWRMVKQTYPEVFSHRAEQSRRLGVKLLKIKKIRMFLDRLDFVSEEDYGPLFDYEPTECGIFCEESGYE